MVIDLEEKSNQLGIDLDDYYSANDKVERAIGDLWWDECTIHFEELPSILTEDELVAYIRWNNLDKRYPELFTWSGVI